MNIPIGRLERVDKVGAAGDVACLGVAAGVQRHLRQTPQVAAEQRSSVLAGRLREWKGE